MKLRLYRLWLAGLRYATVIQKDSARRAGNFTAHAYDSVRLSQIDQELDALAINAPFLAQVGSPGGLVATRRMGDVEAVRQCHKRMTFF